MQGKEYISEVLVGKSTGHFISVLEVPVKDDNGKPIGIVQRNTAGALPWWRTKCGS